MIGRMRFRTALALAPALSVLAGVCAPARALAADEKELCLAAADQGQSLRDDGKYSVAREQFLTCSRPVCPKLVHDQCTDWLRQLDESMPTVVFGVKDERGNDLSAVRVLADGKLAASNLDGKPVSIDPGPHDIRFERDNPTQSVSVHVVLRTGEKNRDVTAAFPPLEGEPDKAPDGSPATPSTPGEASSASGSFTSGRAITSLSLLGAGAVSVVLGVVFGLQSQSEANQGDSLKKDLGTGGCAPSGTTADPRCKTLSDTRDAQNRDAVLNVVFYVAGGALAAGAVATWLLWPRAEAESKPSTTAWIAPVVTPTHAGLSVGGAF
jgi:hypothetical protein